MDSDYRDPDAPADFRRWVDSLHTSLEELARRAEPRSAGAIVLSESAARKMGELLRHCSDPVAALERSFRRLSWLQG
jgi:hypothetical protein